MQCQRCKDRWHVITPAKQVKVVVLSCSINFRADGNIFPGGPSTAKEKMRLWICLIVNLGGMNKGNVIIDLIIAGRHANELRVRFQMPLQTQSLGSHVIGGIVTEIKTVRDDDEFFRSIAHLQVNLAGLFGAGNDFGGDQAGKQCTHANHKQGSHSGAMWVRGCITDRPNDRDHQKKTCRVADQVRMLHPTIENVGMNLAYDFKEFKPGDWVGTVWVQVQREYGDFQGTYFFAYLVIPAKADNRWIKLFTILMRKHPREYPLPRLYRGR